MFPGTSPCAVSKSHCTVANELYDIVVLGEMFCVAASDIVTELYMAAVFPGTAVPLICIFKKSPSVEFKSQRKVKSFVGVAPPNWLPGITILSPFL